MPAHYSHVDDMSIPYPDSYTVGSVPSAFQEERNEEKCRERQDEQQRMLQRIKSLGSLHKAKSCRRNQEPENRCQHQEEPQKGRLKYATIRTDTTSQQRTSSNN